MILLGTKWTSPRIEYIGGSDRDVYPEADLDRGIHRFGAALDTVYTQFLDARPVSPRMNGHSGITTASAEYNASKGSQGGRPTPVRLSQVWEIAAYGLHVTEISHEL